MDIYKLKIIENINRYCFKFFKDPNIISFGLGKKIINGYMLNTPTLTIIVNKKQSLKDINYYNRIPKEINGVLTDIIEANNSPKILTPNAPLVKPMKISLPVRGGGNIKNAKNKDPLGGSMAHIMVDLDKRVHILSTADVLTEDENMLAKADNSDSIISPVASKLLGEFEPPNFNPSNPIRTPVEIAKGVQVLAPKILSIEDEKNVRKLNVHNLGIAAVKTEHSNYVSSGIDVPTNKFEPLKRVKPVNTGDTVYKYSHYSGLIEGRVISTYTFTALTIYSKRYLFREQITVDMPYTEVDRGLLGLIKSNSLDPTNQLSSTFGMCIGGSTRANLVHFTPMDEIYDILKMSLYDIIEPLGYKV